MSNDENVGPWGERGWTGAAGSVIRLSCALTILGARQAAYLALGRGSEANESGRAPRPRATSPVEAVLNQVEEQFGGVFRGVYRLGREYLPRLGATRP